MGTHNDGPVGVRQTMAQLTITVPDLAMPHVLEAKASTETRLEKVFTNEEFIQHVLQTYVLSELGDARHRTATDTAVQQLGDIEVDYPEE